MSETTGNLNRFLRYYLQRLLSDIHETQLDDGPIAGLHSFRWILCHLAVTGDMGRVMLGQDKRCPAAWHAAYGPRSSGVSHDKIRPSKAELLEQLEAVYQQLQELYESAPAELLSQAHPVGLLSQTSIRSNGDLLAHLLTTHFASHVGQLSAMRRAWDWPI